MAAEETGFYPKGGYTNPPALSPKTYTLVTYDELEGDDGELKWVFAKRQCMHCLEPSCVSACLVNALEERPSGAVVWREDLCMGCRYCMVACPFDIPKFEYNKPVPNIEKCTFCFDRQEDGRGPACAKTCPTGCLKFGDRDQLLEVARTRIYQNPDKYFHHIYGEHEAGGTRWLYISPVSFADLGFATDVGTSSYPRFTRSFLTAVPMVIVLWAGLLTGFHWMTKRREEVSAQESAGTKGRSAS